jgi:hypothetical protein
MLLGLRLNEGLGHTGRVPKARRCQRRTEPMGLQHKKDMMPEASALFLTEIEFWHQVPYPGSDYLIVVW